MLSLDECIDYDILLLRRAVSLYLSTIPSPLFVDGHVDSEFIAFERSVRESCPSAVPSASCNSFSRASI